MKFIILKVSGTSYSLTTHDAGDAVVPMTWDEVDRLHNWRKTGRFEHTPEHYDALLEDE